MPLHMPVPTAVPHRDSSQGQVLIWSLCSSVNCLLGLLDASGGGKTLGSYGGTADPGSSDMGSI